MTGSETNRTQQNSSCKRLEWKVIETFSKVYAESETYKIDYT